jgi:hypothetical protein
MALVGCHNKVPAEDVRDLQEKATSHNATDGEMLRFIVAEMAHLRSVSRSSTITTI